MFLPKCKGGLGLIKPRTVYYAKRTSLLISVLNSDDPNVRIRARENFRLHMSKRQVQYLDPTDENNFGGYETDDGYRIIKKSKVNWPKSEFVELNELCIRLNMRMAMMHDKYYLVISNDEDVALMCESGKATYIVVRQTQMSKDISHWESLTNQGKILSVLHHCNMSVSYQHLNNVKLSDKLCAFVVKSRLHLLETNTMLATWYPQMYTRRCHLCNHPNDTVSHVLNGCPNHKSYYIDRHSRTVQHVLNQMQQQNPDWEYHCEIPITDNLMNTHNVFNQCNSNKPDVLAIDRNNEAAYIIEVSHPYDAFIDTCYHSKFEKYLPLCNALNSIGFYTKTVVLIISSSGLVHKKFIPGLKILNIQNSRSIAKYLSVSAMIGSFRIWKKRFDFQTIDNRLL